MAVMIGGGLGDLTIALPYLHALHELTGYRKFDLYVMQNFDRVREIYNNAPFINHIFPYPAVHNLATLYDVVIRANELVLFELNEVAVTQLPQLAAVAMRGIARSADFGKVADVQPLLHNQMANHASFYGLTRQSLILHSGGLDRISDQLLLHINPTHYDVLEDYALLDRPYLTVHDGWDANVQCTDGLRPTKAWLPEYWDELVKNLKLALPHLRIVQLGNAKNGHDIAGVDLNLRGKIGLGQALAILKQAILHIDTESGLVHFARALHTQSVCLFGPTNIDFFGYPQNINLVSALCNNCWWIKKDWMEHCLRGLAIPECMHNLQPGTVCDAVVTQLQKPVFTTHTVAPVDSPGAVIAAGQTVAVFTNPLQAIDAALAGATVVYYAQRFENVHVATGQPYQQQVGDIFNVPADDGQFDHVCFDTAAMPAQALLFAVKEACRILRAGGTIHMTMPADQAAVWPSVAAWLQSPYPFTPQLIIQKDNTPALK